MPWVPGLREKQREILPSAAAARTGLEKAKLLYYK